MSFKGSIGGSKGAAPINGTSQGTGKGSGMLQTKAGSGWGNGAPSPNKGASSAGGDASRFPSLSRGGK